MDSWLEWVNKCMRSPSEFDLASWCGNNRESAEAMGQDIWYVLIIKVKGPGLSAVEHAQRGGGSVLCQCSRVFFQLLQDSRGRTRDGKGQMWK